MKKKQIPADLVLNLKAEYFDQIRDGTKQYEFRLQNDYWMKRLLIDGVHMRTFSNVIIRKGYPKAGTLGREIIRPWLGATIQTITHPHFGKEPVAVFAIPVNPLQVKS